MKILKYSIALILTASAVVTTTTSADVSIYGKARASIAATDDGSTNGTATEVASHSSRIGFKGNEAVSDDLTVEWKIESKISVDTGGLAAGARNTYLGIKGAMGTLRIGKIDTPYKMISGKYDAFGDTQADYNAIVGRSGANKHDTRAGNNIQYLSKRMNGFQIKASYLADETRDSVADDGYSISGEYATDDFNLGLAYQSLNEQGVAGDNDTGLKVGGQWKGLEHTIFSLLYEVLDDGGSNGDHNTYYGSVVYNMGLYTLKAAAGQAGDKGGVSNTGATLLSLGLTRNVSKSTELYANYVKLENDTLASYGLDNPGVAVASGDAATALSFGINYKFSSK